MLKSPIWVFLVAVTFLNGCMSATNNTGDLSGKESLNVVATTNLVGDLLTALGGERVEVVSLMGPGIDPHLYKASEGDVSRMAEADIIFYNGLHLEGKMVEIFEQMNERGSATVAVTDGVDQAHLIESQSYGGNFDPHVWFDVSLWTDVARYVTETLASMNSANAAYYQSNLDDYLERLAETDEWVRSTIEILPPEQRVLITSHDAFGYFGKAYGFEVYGLQGISTIAEAGTADVQSLSTMVAERRIPAIFVESSVPRRGIEAVREAVQAKGFDVVIGGSLFSDALGSANTPEGEYTGMVRHNVQTIVSGLNGDEHATQ